MDNLGLAIKSPPCCKKSGCLQRVYPASLKSFDLSSIRGWPECSGIGGRITSDWVAGIDRNQWPDWTGKRTILLSSSGLAQLTTLNVGYSAISEEQLPAWIAKETGI